jgi:ppGpp synthetase/RelA/SpoT-type nucleotidyltranferase
LAGVRVDIDCDLDVQTALGDEIAAWFRNNGHTAIVKDLRNDPHSGYRAVHIWLRLPAGRVEVQLRTHSQSVWANTYERLGDLAGRGIRYGQQHESEVVNRMVGHLHKVSRALAALELEQQEIADLMKRVADLSGRRADDPDLVELERRVDALRSRNIERRRTYVESLQEVTRILEHEE